MTAEFPNFDRYDLDIQRPFFAGMLSESLRSDGSDFEDLWSLHPDKYHEIQIHGRLVKTPRCQQAFGRDYDHTGNINRALAITPHLAPFLAWAQESIFDRLNGLLLNWYDGRLSHHIGEHHDGTKGMVHDAPIVPVSLGEERIFRLTQPKTKERRDFPAHHGTVFVMPFANNAVWKHSVPRFVRWQGRRISITLRTFDRSPESDSRGSGDESGCDEPSVAELWVDDPSKTVTNRNLTVVFSSDSEGM